MRSAAAKIGIRLHRVTPGIHALVSCDRPRPFTGRGHWWAHSAFTRINITPTILRKRIEDPREAGVVEVHRYVN